MNFWSRRTARLRPRLTSAFWIFVLLAGMMGGAVHARAQNPADLEQIRSRFPAAAARSLEQTLREAERSGLPTAPLVAKALEGAAKQVPPPQVVAAVRQLAGDLRRARTLLGGRAGAGETIAAADALRRGAPAEGIRRLSAAAQSGEPLDLTVHVYADLIAQGIPPDAALEVLAAWRERGADPKLLREVPTAVARRVREGASPAAAAAEVGAAVRAGQSPASAGKGGSKGKGNAAGKAQPGGNSSQKNAKSPKPPKPPNSKGKGRP